MSFFHGTLLALFLGAGIEFLLLVLFLLAVTPMRHAVIGLTAHLHSTLYSPTFWGIGFGVAVFMPLLLFWVSFRAQPR
ncbi:MAG: hypothetical protein JO356_16455 [Acidobacteria bacterium]|nr:hypothetical protein [Acidobacteriota bacterium]